MVHERTTHRKLLVVEVPEDLHARAKAKVAKERTSLRQVIIRALEEFVTGKKAA